MGSGSDCGIVLRHPLACAEELHRRCVINGQSASRAGRAMGFDPGICKGVIRLIRAVGMPSPERRAVICMMDWGLENADIAEMFGRTERWARLVREQKEEIREAEYIPAHLEYIDPGLQPSDPDPVELHRRAAEVRARRPGDWKFDTAMPKSGPSNGSPSLSARYTRGGLRVFSWNGRNATLFPVVAEKWTGR